MLPSSASCSRTRASSRSPSSTFPASSSSIEGHYYDRLQNIRDRGEWEEWFAFFLDGVATVSRDATETARAIVGLRERKRALINETLGRRAGAGHRLLDALFRQPVVNVKMVRRITRLSQPAANALTNAMAEIGILRETTGKQTYRVFEFRDYMELFRERRDRG